MQAHLLHQRRACSCTHHVLFLPIIKHRVNEKKPTILPRLGCRWASVLARRASLTPSLCCKGASLPLLSSTPSLRNCANSTMAATATVEDTTQQVQQAAPVPVQIVREGLELPASQRVRGQYSNLDATAKPIGAFNLLTRMLGRAIKGQVSHPDRIPQENEYPIHHRTVATLESLARDAVEFGRLGHSSLFLRTSAQLWLIDPVFGERASPMSWAGPKRFHPVPLDWTNIPEVTAIVLSHNHYDHLCKHTVLTLQDRTKWFLCPLGVGDYLRKFGVDDAKIIEFDWWDQATVEGAVLTATPTQHFSGRTAFDRMQSLWCGWSIELNGKKVFFTGDSGYCAEFATIGKALGPFDLAAVENGAYYDLWPEVHMFPEQTMQAFLDLQAKDMFPVHNGTFPLGFHSWREPLERIVELAKEHDIIPTIPRIGQPILVGEPFTFDPWFYKPEAVEEK
eukprot:m.15012 g.15012  ORF g.15012 m.15012 type:complete len:451 (+) comp6482_c0_seq1:62-1414(+)